MLKRTGRGGFSLVELLVGVTILAIIVTPVVHAFLTSQNASKRAGEMRSQTVAAQNVIEAYKATDIGALIAKYKSLQFGTKLGAAAVSSITAMNGAGTYEPVTPTSTEAKNGAGYKVYLTGADAGTKLYDAVLSIDASAYAAANSALIVDYKPMDEVYVQPDPVNDPNNDPDIFVAKEFASRAQIESGNAVPDTYFYDYNSGNIVSRMTRKITITISRAGGASTPISCTAAIQYDARYAYSVTDRDGVVHHYELPLSREMPAEFVIYASNLSDVKGVYFFYYPNSTTQSDTIEILNRDNVVLSIYLIRQSPANTAYTPAINLRETYVSVNQPQNAAVYYNRDTEKPQPASLKYYMNEFHRPLKDTDGVMVDTAAVNRLYGVKVELYKAGSNFSGTPLSSFDASALK